MAALQTLWGPGEYREEMNEMLVEQAALEAVPPKSALQLVSDWTVRWQLISLSTIYFCNQMSGMSAVSFNSPPRPHPSYLKASKHWSQAAEVTAVSPPSQITIFSFDIFLKVGIPRDKIRYVTLCLGACEIITSISCVSSTHRSQPDHDSDALYTIYYQDTLWDGRHVKHLLR